MTKRRPFEGQVALVSGGGKGIGRAIALRLAADGARLVVTGRVERSLGETVGEIANAGGQARHVVGDVREDGHAFAAVSRAWETWGRLDVVVANAGIAGTTRLGEGDAAANAGSGESRKERRERARSILETNLLGTYDLFDAALERMAGPGRLVAISSVLGKFGAPGQAAYCASKAGLHGLVRAVALDVGPRGITCNAICPGWVDTAMARARIADIAAEQRQDVAVATRAAKDAVPIRRFVEAEEVAGLVAFLCSSSADAVTGQALSICGGSTVFAG